MSCFSKLGVGIFMNYGHFGEFLKYVRKSSGMTLEQLSNGICSVRQLSRIEKGENTASLFILHYLSEKLNIDLQEYSRIFFTSGNFKAYSIKNSISNLIKNQDLVNLKEFINSVEDLDEFKYGENKQYILYSRALCLTYLDYDYLKSIDYCLEGLKIEDKNFRITEITDRIYSSVGLTMINLISVNYDKLGKTDLSFLISEQLFALLENQIFNSKFNRYSSQDFEKKLYQSLGNNLSFFYMNKKQYHKSFEFVDKSIKFSIEQSYMRFLPELLLQKSKLLFKMGMIYESHESYKACLNFYKVLRNDDEVRNLEKEIKDLFYDTDYND